jgi:hypothetical protein
MTWVSRRVLISLVVAAVGSSFTACSNSSANGVVGTSGQDAFVLVDTSSGPFVEVENRTEQPLIDVSIGLKAGILTFSDSISRLEPKEKRRLRHADFTSRDGTSFSLRVATPKTVLITARDLTGKTFETSRPW